MPFVMDGYVQSVVVEGTVYVGGGSAGKGNDYIVMTYDISTGKWATLPPYRARSFAMTSINDQLVLVGGIEHGVSSKVVRVWDADNKQWTHPYPEMHTERSGCSAVVHNEWLLVAGGLQLSASFSLLSSVEVMNTNSKQWYAGPPTPRPWSFMKTATVGDECYFMGGTGSPTNTVYSVSLSALTTGLNSSTSKGQKIWMKISGLQTTCSTPLSIRGSLLAVGGKDKGRKAVTAIHLYTGEWVKVGDLPTPRSHFTCAMITDRELLVSKESGITNIALIKRT